MNKLKFLAVGALALLVLFLMGKWWSDARFFSAYDHDLPLNPRVEELRTEPGYTMTKLYFDGEPGETVPTLLAQPKDASSPMPCIVFLHGIGQEKEFLDDIAPIYCPSGFAIVTFDQYTRGERRLPKDASALTKLTAFKTRAAKTVVDTRRLLDYLAQRPDIAQDRIYLLGVSYGAVTGSTAMALDKRLAAGVLMYGGGDFSILLNSPAVNDDLGAFAGIVKPLTSWYLRPSDPILYVAGIAPRPVLFQNGSRDSIVVPAAGKALADAAKDPKEVVWYDSEHVGLDEAHTRKVLDDARVWLLKQDDPFRKVAEGAQAAGIANAA
ncbi:MAG: alpha/beta fold hydrolase [Candidatus Hydrogenedentes bacterium]|nr:alpha/beta fold hydrolase [Candidatus Hydrogenedentota bacterium]